MFDSRYFHGESHFEGDKTQKYLVFRPVYECLTIADANKDTEQKSKGLSDKCIKPLPSSDNSLNPGITFIDNSKVRVEFDQSCLKQDKVTITHKQVLNIYIVYEINFEVIYPGF